jgi:hypothetical protein
VRAAKLGTGIYTLALYFPLVRYIHSLGKNCMYFLNIYVLTNALYVLTEDRYIIFWDVQMIEGPRTKNFILR